MELQQIITQAVELLRLNQPVALPTETVYGLAARLMPEAIEAVYRIKQRPADNPLIVHVSSVEMARRCISAEQDLHLFEQLAAAFWPGPITFVLKKSELISDEVSRGLDTVAIRLPAHPIMQQVLSALNEPLVAPSANLSGRPSPTQAKHVVQDFQDQIALVIDGGACEFGLESTVLDLSTATPCLLRPGAISQAEIETLFAKPIDVQQKMSKPRSPGMKYRHYSPVYTEVRLVEEAEFIALAAEGLDQSWFAAVGIEPDETTLSLSAQNLYDLFRQADLAEVKQLYLLDNAALRENTALFNRVLKAVSPI